MVRRTIQRALVMEAVQSLACHPTAETVYSWVQTRQPHVSRATIYRNLGNLADDGEIRRILMPNSPDRFDFNCSEHYHIVCEKCGEFEDVSLEYFSEADKEVTRKTGWKCAGHDIVFKGICADCINSAE